VTLFDDISDNSDCVTAARSRRRKSESSTNLNI